MNLDAKEELFALSDQYNLDEYLDRTMSEKGELAPLDNLIRGHTRPDRKRLKTEDLKPIVFVNFNTSAIHQKVPAECYSTEIL